MFLKKENKLDQKTHQYSYNVTEKTELRKHLHVQSERAQLILGKLINKQTKPDEQNNIKHETEPCWLLIFKDKE